MHEHKKEKKPKQCKHVLEFCKECNTVYCEKCKMEWHEGHVETETERIIREMPDTTFPDIGKAVPMPYTPNVPFWSNGTGKIGTPGDNITFCSCKN